MTQDERLFCNVMHTALDGIPNRLAFRMAKLAATPHERRMLVQFDKPGRGNSFLRAAAIANVWARILVEAAKQEGMA